MHHLPVQGLAYFLPARRPFLHQGRQSCSSRTRQDRFRLQQSVINPCHCCTSITTLANMGVTHTHCKGRNDAGRLSSRATEQVTTASYLVFFMGFFTELSSSSLPESASFVAKAGLPWAACTEGLPFLCIEALSFGHHNAAAKRFEQARNTAGEYCTGHSTCLHGADVPHSSRLRVLTPASGLPNRLSGRWKASMSALPPNADSSAALLSW